MPPRKYTNRKNKTQSKALAIVKKMQKKKSVFRNKIEPIDRLFPQHKVLKMKYSAALGMGTGVTQNNFSGTNHLWLLNSIYQPKVSAPGFRVQGYDQISSIYKRYKVYGVKVTIRATNPSQDGLYLGIRFAQHDNTDYLSGEYVGPAMMKRWTKCIPINNTGKQVVSYSRYWDIAAMQGLTKTQFSADNRDYCAHITANPVKSPYLEIAICNTQDITDANMFISVDIEYVVQLYDRQVLPNTTV